MAQTPVKRSKPHPVPKYKSWCGQAQAEEQKQAYKLTISSRGALASPAAAKPRLSRSFELAAVIPSGAGAFLRTWENPNTQLRQIQQIQIQINNWERLYPLAPALSCVLEKIQTYKYDIYKYIKAINCKLLYHLAPTLSMLIAD